VIRKRETNWQSAEERARVAAELIEEAETLTERGVATPADLKRANLPPPLAASAPLPVPVPAPALPSEASVEEEDPLAALNETIAASPDDPALLRERALRLAELGRYAAAKRDLERVLKRHPDDIAALTSLGMLLSRKGLWAEAVRYLTRVVEREPERGEVWYQLGETLNRLNDLAGSRAAYERAVALEPSHRRALYGLGIVLDRLMRPDEATQMYRRSREAGGR
jgi:Flp pilus assembly protein TadD